MLHELFIGDDEYELRDSGPPFAKAIHFKAPMDMLVKFNCVCPVDELTPIDGLPIFNHYIELANESDSMFGIQLKVKDI